MDQAESNRRSSAACTRASMVAKSMRNCGRKTPIRTGGTSGPVREDTGGHRRSAKPAAPYNLTADTGGIRMRRHLTGAGLLVVVLVAAACGSSTSKTASSPSSPTPTSASSSTAGSPSSPAPVSVRQDAKVGKILVDAHGLTVDRDGTEGGG